MYVTKLLLIKAIWLTSLACMQLPSSYHIGTGSPPPQGWAGPCDLLSGSLQSWWVFRLVLRRNQETSVTDCVAIGGLIRWLLTDQRIKAGQ